MTSSKGGMFFFLSVNLSATQNMSNIRVEVPRSLDAQKLGHGWVAKHTSYKVHTTYHHDLTWEGVLTTPILVVHVFFEGLGFRESWMVHVFLTRLAIVRNTIKRKGKGRCINCVFIALSTSTRNGLPSLKLYVHSWRVCV